MKALYPMVGGTATTHKFNLKDPRDNALAFRLTFNGGWIHTSNGAQPNGTDGFANTFLTPTTSLSLNSIHISYYSKHNAQNNSVLMGCAEGNNPSTTTELQPWTLNSNSAHARISDGSNFESTATVTNSFGFYIANRTNSSQVQLYKGISLLATFSKTSSRLTPWSIYLGARNASGSANLFTNRGCAFASIGDGLTDLESLLFYQIVEKYQYTLGRNVNANQSFYYDRNYTNETNAFIVNGGITDTTQRTAVNTLVSTLKTAGIWTKMKAVYPMVGGTATAHKFNLVNPVDTNAAFRLVFNGGWTHSSTGALPNGTTAYSNTFITPSTTLTQYNTHLSYYSRTNILETSNYEIGSYNGSGGNLFGLTLPRNTGIARSVQYEQFTQSNVAIVSGQTNTTGFWMGNRTSNTGTTHKLWKNGVSISSATTTGGSLLSNTIWIGAMSNGGGSPFAFYSSKQCAFASIGDGLTDAEATTFYNAVQAFQTTLGRQV